MLSRYRMPQLNEDSSYSYGQGHGHRDSMVCYENITKNKNGHLMEVKQIRKIY